MPTQTSRHEQGLRFWRIHKWFDIVILVSFVLCYALHAGFPLSFGAFFCLFFDALSPKTLLLCDFWDTGFLWGRHYFHRLRFFGGVLIVLTNTEYFLGMRWRRRW